MSLVLLVQAQPQLAQQWSLALNPYYDVVVVDGPTKALASARDGGFDVVVIDCNDDSIVAFANELDQLPDAPPLVLVSDSPRAPRLSTQVGAAGFVPKPCEGVDLIGAVSRVIDTKVNLDLPSSLFDDEPTSRNIALPKL